MRDDDQHTEDQHRDHMRRIAEIMRSFNAGEISPVQKRRYIADENSAYYRDADARSHSTGEKLTVLPYAVAGGSAPPQAGCPPTAAYLEARAALDERRSL